MGFKISPKYNPKVKPSSRGTGTTKCPRAREVSPTRWEGRGTARAPSPIDCSN